LPARAGPVWRAAHGRMGGPHGPRGRAHGAAAFQIRRPGRRGPKCKAAVEAVKGTNARLFINDHWQAALDAGAYGIHVGQEDLDVIGQRDLEPSAARAHAWASPPMATPRWCAPMPCSPAISPWAPYSHHAQEDGDRPKAWRVCRPMCD
jgi:hypothetical protein